MGALAGLYSGLFKRTSTFTLAICIGAVGVSLSVIIPSISNFKFYVSV